MDIIVLNENERAACVIPHGLYLDDLHHEDLTGELTYEFAVPGDHSVAAELVEERQVLFTDLDGDIRIMRIKRLTETHAGTHTLRAFCESAHVELGEDIVRPTTWLGASPETILEDVLAGTRYEVGQCDYAGAVFNFTWRDYGSALAAIRQLASDSGLELRYRAEFANNAVTHRYVDMLTRRGRDTHKTIEYGKDALGITRVTDSSTLVTALIGLGKAGATEGTFTTFASLTADDKPVSQDWIGDESARDAFGALLTDGTRKHRFGVFRDSEETSATKLLAKTRAELARRISAALTYTVDAALLDALGYEHERVSLGDGVIVRDLTFNPPLSVVIRIAEIDRSYADPTK